MNIEPAKYISRINNCLLYTSYQVPAMMLSGITVVISPLISLMQDQVKSLNDVGINAAYVNSTLSESEICLLYTSRCV